MALIKPIRQKNGITTNYHRILSVTAYTNSHNSITVLSYTDKEAREQEAGEEQPYKVAVTYQAAYDDTMTVENAYNYIKALQQFENATDA